MHKMLIDDQLIIRCAHVVVHMNIYQVSMPHCVGFRSVANIKTDMNECSIIHSVVIVRLGTLVIKMCTNKKLKLM